MKHRQIKIVAYHGCGNAHALYLTGRVLKDKEINAAADEDTVWDNLSNMRKRFFSAEIPHARVRARFQNIESDFVADDEGYFEVCIEPAQPLPENQLWHEIELELISPLRKGVTPARTTARVLVPPPDAQFAVISDIDDTVIHTDTASLFRMARNVFLGNSRTRLPLAGVATFYQALFHGNGQTAGNPLFYISNSPWSLYDLLCEFFSLHNFPIGPVLFLRHWDFTKKDQIPTRKLDHKLSAARAVLERFPHLPFILIGDSSEKDPEIYAELVRQFPERIRAIYIRNASRKLQRPLEIQALAEKVLQAGSTLILADSTLPYAQHAVQQGWITPDFLSEIDSMQQPDSVVPTVVVEQIQTGPFTVPASPILPENAIQTALETGDAENQQSP